MTEPYAVDDYGDIARRLSALKTSQPSTSHRYGLWSIADNNWTHLRVSDGRLFTANLDRPATFHEAPSPEEARAYFVGIIRAWAHVEPCVELREFTEET